MNRSASLILVVIVTTLCASVSAKTISIKGNSKTQVGGKCGESGGIFFPSSKTNRTYGCVNQDGTGIVCGGTTTAQKKTCDTFKKLPPRLPSRSEAAKTGSDTRQ